MSYGGEEPSSDCSSQSEELVLADYTERPLRLAGRPPMTGLQKLFTGLFYAQLLFQLIAGAALWQTQSVTPAINGACPEGFELASNNVYLCVNTQLGSCNRRLHWNRRLQERNTVWNMLGRHSGLPATTIGVSSVLCVLVLFSLTFAAGCVTWGMFVFTGLLMLYGFYLTSNWMLLVAVCVIAALTYWRREDINAAITSMKVGSEALQATPRLFLLCAAIQSVWFVYALVFMWFTTFNMQRFYDVVADCEPSVTSLAMRLYMYTCPFLFVVTTFFFRYCVLAVCSLAVGSWCFKEEAAEQGFSSSGAATLGMELAFSTSCGSIFGASIILSIVDAIRKKVSGDSMLWWLDPTSCFLRMIWCAIEGSIGSLTRFALIGHMFQGDGLCSVAHVTGGMLQRRLPGILATGIVSECVTRQLATMGATAVGFFVWWWLDYTERQGFFGTVKSFVDDDLWDNTNNDAGSGAQAVILLLTLLMLWCVRNPILTIVVALSVGLLDWDDGWTSTFTISVVLASFVAIIFNYFATVLEFSTDTAFYCMALEAESSKRNVRLQPLHDISQKRAEKEEGEEEAIGNNL